MPFKPLKRLPNWVIYGAIALVVAILLVIAFRPSPISVEVGQVERNNLQVTVDEEGKTRVRDRFTVAAPVAGRLRRIALEAGDPVAQGQVVARIDPLPLNAQVAAAQARLRELRAQREGVETQRPKQATLAQAEARIRAAEAAQRAAAARVLEAQAALTQARRDRQRSESLVTEGAISRQDFELAQLEETTREQELTVAERSADAAQAEVVAAQRDLDVLEAEQVDPDYLLRVYDAQIAQVEADLATLADDAAQTEISAPQSGNVLRVMQESARYVEAGTELLEVGNAENLELVVDVLSTDAVRIQPGNLILVDQWGGDTLLRATVRSVEPSAFTEISALGVEEQRVNVIADFDQASVPLRDGFRVEARIVVWAGEDVLTVPVSALFRCEDADWCVFAVEGDRAQQRPVQIGPRSDLLAELQAGLEEGATVILHPTDEIESGKRVAPR
jgi:HlyD family secretion protein